MPSEQEQFLKDTKDTDTTDPFEAPLNPEEANVSKEVTKDSTKSVDEENPEDNREARRAKRALREERKAGAFLAERLSETNQRLDRIVEAKSISGEEAADHLKAIEKIYGTDSPEAVAATELLKTAFTGVHKKAVDDALKIFREEQQKEKEEVVNAEGELDSMLEELEDEYDIDLTSKASEPLQKAFFKRLEKLSPKDRNGNIVHYADHRAVWEDLQSQMQQQKKTDTRAKDISSRSMVNSASADSTTNSAEEKFLKDNGII